MTDVLVELARDDVRLARMVEGYPDAAEAWALECARVYWYRAAITVVEWLLT